MKEEKINEETTLSILDTIENISNCFENTDLKFYVFKCQING